MNTTTSPLPRYRCWLCFGKSRSTIKVEVDAADKFEAVREARRVARESNWGDPRTVRVKELT